VRRTRRDRSAGAKYVLVAGGCSRVALATVARPSRPQPVLRASPPLSGRSPSLVTLCLTLLPLVMDDDDDDDTTAPQTQPAHDDTCTHTHTHTPTGHVGDGIWTISISTNHRRLEDSLVRASSPLRCRVWFVTLEPSQHPSSWYVDSAVPALARQDAESWPPQCTHSSPLERSKATALGSCACTHAFVRYDDFSC
jgi:hypothetical protein